ncbi:hypothetical protein [Calothrix sp. NIES-2098]|uniref:hypothetical protein n=1 Tax=Calothrix sp. NIES-2098 TaxID=1954171 RepID=UPI000B5EC970|nr:GUN4 domain protein [Calothrix sp. NIES-2098]
MSNNSNNPREYDAVLGNQPIPLFAAVLGGIEGVKQQLATNNIEHRIAALTKALKYEDRGLNLIIEALNDPEDRVKEEAYTLLKTKEEVKLKNVLHRFISQYYFLRFDGIYQEDVQNGVYRYIRFYSDGTVITVSSTGNAEQITSWFFKENNKKTFSIGTYIVDSENIIFSSSCDIGTVEYWGNILMHSNTILLKWYSHINGCSGNSRYNFIQLF